MPVRPVDPERVRVELAHVLRDLRVSRGWTLRELSERSGVDLRSLSAYEQARRLAPLDVLVDIFCAYNVKLTDALADTYPFGDKRRPRKVRPLTDRRLRDDA